MAFDDIGYWARDFPPTARDQWDEIYYANRRGQLTGREVSMLRLFIGGESLERIARYCDTSIECLRSYWLPRLARVAGFGARA